MLAVEVKRNELVDNRNLLIYLIFMIKDYPLSMKIVSAHLMVITKN